MFNQDNNPPRVGELFVMDTSNGWTLYLKGWAGSYLPLSQHITETAARRMLALVFRRFHKDMEKLDVLSINELANKMVAYVTSLHDRAISRVHKMTERRKRSGHGKK